jgi:hypothetical protein
MRQRFMALSSNLKFEISNAFGPRASIEGSLSRERPLGKEFPRRLDIQRDLLA